MADGKGELPKQKTPKGYEIPLPKRGEILNAFQEDRQAQAQEGLTKPRRRMSARPHTL